VQPSSQGEPSILRSQISNLRHILWSDSPVAQQRTQKKYGVSKTPPHTQRALPHLPSLPLAHTYLAAHALFVGRTLEQWHRRPRHAAADPNPRSPRSGSLTRLTGAAATPPPEASPQMKLPAVGARVRCEGLTGATELNGCLGCVASHEGDRARVQIDGPCSRMVGMRLQNLIVVLGLSDVLQVPGLFAAEVLRRLGPTALALLRRVDHAFRAAVESSSDLPRAGVSEEVPLEVSQFVGSVALLAWAKEHGCPWIESTLALAAEGGILAVVQ